jgi:hypothetical protein
MSKNSWAVVFCIAALSLHSAFAADSSTNSDALDSLKGPEDVSSLNEKSKPSSNVLDRFYADYFGTFHGPEMNNLSSAYTVNNKGQVGGKMPKAINFDSELTTAYIIDKDSGIGIGPDFPFLASPVLGQGLTEGDFGIKAFNKKTIDTGNFRLYTNIYVQAPTSPYSQLVNMKYAVKTTPYFWYHFSGSRFMVGAWTEAKSYQGVTADKTFKLYAAPYVNYQLTPKLSLNVEYEMEAHHNVGAPRALDFTSYETDLQPGFVWNVTNVILVNPFVQIFTGNKITYDSTALGAVISARLL